MKKNKLCECCQKAYKTQQYCFSNKEASWTRTYCKKCLKAWQKKTKKLEDLSTIFLGKCKTKDSKGFVNDIIKGLSKWIG